MTQEEIYVSTDIETDGPIPGPHSMLSLGSAAFKGDGTMIDSFEVNLRPLDGAKGHPDTMKWWGTQPKAWAAHRHDLFSPTHAMQEYVSWLDHLPGLPVFVGYPATFDFMFVYHYLMSFIGRSPFSFSAIDIKTYAMAVLKKPYRESTKKNMPKRWLGNQPHTHKALDDAIGQGILFCNMLKQNRG